MKLPEVVFWAVVAIVLGLALCALYLPAVAIAKVVRAVFGQHRRTEAAPPMPLRHWP